MTTANPFVQLLPDLTKKPQMIPAEQVKHLEKLDPEALNLFKRAGLTAAMLQKSIEEDVKISYDRFNIYEEVRRATEHWFVGPAMNLYGNQSTSYNPIHNATVWITSQSETYAKELNTFLNNIGIEEKIFDWAFSTAVYGDMFVRLNAVPGLGIISIEDGMHPMNLSRVEYDGILVGFYKTPQGNAQLAGQTDYTGEKALIPPWDFVHFRLLGAKQKRPRYPGDPSQTEMRQIHLITGTDTTQVTTRYGTSLIMDALPAYKRLRLAEDSVLLARLTRGIIKYIWKLKIDSSTGEAAAALIDQYASLITHARAIDTSAGSPTFDSKNNQFSVLEDLFVPVWGSVEDLKVEKVGGEVDIRWIVDVDNLRNQLAFALACSPSLGGAYTKEASGALGSEALSELGIRFARSCRRLQRALISGITRMCQIHLAYMGYDPDPSLFQVHMAETSTAEEAQLMKSLDSGMKSLSTFIKTLKMVAGKRIDTLKVWDYWSDKILKMDDFHISNFFKSKKVLQQEMEMQQQLAAAKAEKETPEGIPGEKKPVGLSPEGVVLDGDIDSLLIETIPISSEAIKESIERFKDKLKRANPIFDLDIRSYVPVLSEKLEDIKKEFKEEMEFAEFESKMQVKGVKLMEARLPKENQGSLLWSKQRDARIWEQKFGKAKLLFEDELEELKKKEKEIPVEESEL